ncbi:M12 family metallopeptidase [Kitasatospora sp. NBC_00458]|uniref:M12 family metallopeptidase n=1 Tax=Kitasatospora sp. NBC_00458 TaxID=2903568 RepID=UPI002E17FC17
MKPSAPRVPRLGLAPDRAGAILQTRSKWLNGTVLHYCFLDQGGPDRPPGQADAVRSAIQEWEDLGIGLDFREVADRSEAEVRISFKGDKSESAVGRGVLQISRQAPTTSYGWDLTDESGRSTALHELGHVLGFEHEHQNPNAGITWDKEVVIEALAQPPNEWDRATTIFNIIRKLDPSEVTGSPFDKDSVMEYPIQPGWILRPKRLRLDGIPEPLSLSATDKEEVLRWYPTLVARPHALQPRVSALLPTGVGDQADFEITPAETRKYAIATFGDADVVMALFERINGELRYVTAEDDSGEDRNGRLDVKLFKGRSYVLRARIYSVWGAGEASLMHW